MTAVTRPTGPRAVEGVVEYKPTAMQQKVFDVLGSPRALSILRPLIPKGVDHEAVFVEVYRAATINPAILRCTEASIIMAVADCLRVGLMIGKTIHLVPLKMKVRGVNGAPDTEEEQLQAWTDFKGDIELVVGSGAARLVDSHAVYEHDRFEVHFGTNPDITHRPPLTGPRGKMIGAYSVAFITQTIKKVCWMRLDEIEAIRAKSKQWNPNKVKECPEWYACKTTVHRITKDIPKNPRLAKVLAMFARQDELEHAEEAEYTIEPAPAGEGQSAPVAAAPDDRRDVSYDEHGEADRAVTREESYPDVPPCPKCKGPVYDNRAENNKRATEGQRLRPDFVCKNRNGCDGKYWRDEWPPQDDEAQGDLRF